MRVGCSLLCRARTRRNFEEQELCCRCRRAARQGEEAGMTKSTPNPQPKKVQTEKRESEKLQAEKLQPETLQPEELRPTHVRSDQVQAAAAGRQQESAPKQHAQQGKP